MKTLFLIGLLSLSSPEPIYIMEISYIYMFIDTVNAVNCDEFENFGSIIKTINISDQKTIEKVWNSMDELTIDESAKYPPDTRRKVRIWKDGCAREACMDYFSIYYKGKIYVYDGEFRSIIEGFIENHSE